MSQIPRTLSIVVPLFNESENLASLLRRLERTRREMSKVRVELVLVDDGSTDSTYEKLWKLSDAYENLRIIRIFENAGSHAAINVGLREAKGEMVAFIAGDLQDPPELMERMVSCLKDRTTLVWAARNSIAEQAPVDRIFSRVYWSIANAVCGYSFPPGGVDFALMSRSLANRVTENWNQRVPLFLLLAEQQRKEGGRSAIVFYEKQKRAEGKSGWTLQKKLELIRKTITFPLYSPTAKLLSTILCAISVTSALASAIRRPPVSNANTSKRFRGVKLFFSLLAAAMTLRSLLDRKGSGLPIYAVQLDKN